MYSPTPATPVTSVPEPQGQLIQTLLNLASPGTARYQAHRLRPDGVYRVVVRTTEGVQILSIPAPAMLLTELGILNRIDTPSSSNSARQRVNLP